MHIRLIRIVILCRVSFKRAHASFFLLFISVCIIIHSDTRVVYFRTWLIKPTDL